MSEKRKPSATFGTKLKRGDVYVARLTNINPPEITRDDKDVTDHDSPNMTREFMPGLKDGGEVPIEGFLIPTEETHLGLAAAVNSQEPEPWTIEFPTNPKVFCRFNGYVNAFKVGEAPVDGELRFTAKIKVTGLPRLEADVSAGLSDLVVKGAEQLDLMPAFDGSVGEYFATANAADATISVTPTAEGHTITVNGAIVPSGMPSGPIALKAGEMTKIKIVAVEEGKAPATYFVKVFRPET